MKPIACTLIFMFCSTIARTQTSSHDKGPSFGYKFDVHSGLQKPGLGISAGITMYDDFLDRCSGKPNDFCMISNHQLFAAGEINYNDQLTIAPKFGYELNYVFVTGRLNFLQVFDMKGKTISCGRPEIGATIFGAFSLTYGYNLIDRKKSFANDLISKHMITFTYNRF